jgi:hypothetical protein
MEKKTNAVWNKIMTIIDLCNRKTFLSHTLYVMILLLITSIANLNNKYFLNMLTIKV